MMKKRILPLGGVALLILLTGCLKREIAVEEITLSDMEV